MPLCWFLVGRRGAAPGTFASTEDSQNNGLTQELHNKTQPTPFPRLQIRKKCVCACMGACSLSHVFLQQRWPEFEAGGALEFTASFLSNKTTLHVLIQAYTQG